MRTSRGPIRRALMGVVLAALAGGAVVTPAAVAATTTPPGARVTIVRDSRGEPHIRGESAPATMYGFAWAQMEDQAPFILGLMAQSAGRSAELLGPDCPPSLQACFRSDQLARLFRVPESARAGYGKLPARDRARLKAFADGINAYIASGAGNVPSWAVRVTPQDVLANVQYRFVMAQVREVGAILTGGGGGGDDEDARVAGRRLADAAARFEFPASNMFALSGRKTKSGRPILQGDPHLPFDGISRWYAAQLSYPGNRVQGVTFRGLPGIALGSNDYVAWSNTANHNTQHEQDAYVESTNPANPNQYRYGGAYRDMAVRKIVMKVRTASGVQSIPVTLRYTLHGPVISDPPAQVDGSQAAPRGFTVSAKVSQYRQFRLATQLWRESEARSVAQYKQAMSLNQLSSLNALVADRKNNLFFVAASRSGIIKPGVKPNSLLDGSNPDNDWQGILPFSQLPQAQNPRSGYFENANNAPWFTAPDQIREEDLPFYLQGGSDTSRSRRLVQILGPQTRLGAPFRLTQADVQRFGMDTFLEFGPSLRSLLNAAAADPGADAKVRYAAALINAWPGAKRLRATKGATAYPLFATWKRGLNQRVLGFNPTNPPAAGTAWSPSQKAEARRAMVVAWDGMTRQYKTVVVPYGFLHTFTWGSFSAPVNGGDTGLETVRLTNCKNQPGSDSPIYYRPCAVRGGSSNIFNVNLATGRFTVSRPVSDTDDPASPFYTLNARDYVADRYRDFPITNAEVAAERTSRRMLTLP